MSKNKPFFSKCPQITNSLIHSIPIIRGFEDRKYQITKRISYKYLRIAIVFRQMLIGGRWNGQTRRRRKKNQILATISQQKDGSVWSQIAEEHKIIPNFDPTGSFSKKQELPTLCTMKRRRY